MLDALLFQWLERRDGWWGHELREHVRQSLVADVQTRATKEQPDRKDMQDLTTMPVVLSSLVNHFPAAVDLPNIRKQTVRHQEILQTAGGPLSELERHRLKTILTDWQLQALLILQVARFVSSVPVKITSICFGNVQDRVVCTGASVIVGFRWHSKSKPKWFSV